LIQAQQKGVAKRRRRTGPRAGRGRVSRYAD